MKDLLIAAVLGVALALATYSAMANPTEPPQEPKPVARAEAPVFIYPIEIVNIYDGDTVTAKVQWRPGVSVGNYTPKAKLRLFGIDTPEIRAVADRTPGYAARDFLKALVADREVRAEVVVYKKRPTGKFGRWLVRLWVKGKGQWCFKDQWCDANSYMVKKGHARVYLP